MKRTEDTYRNWIKGSENGRATALFWMAQGMIDKLGEEEGLKLFVKQINKMAENWADMTLKSYEKQGKENSLTLYLQDIASDDSVYSFAWEGGLKESSIDGGVIEWTSCPIAAGFKSNGARGVEVGEVFCDHIDNAFIRRYNSRYEIVRESSLNREGLCRLRVKRKG